MSFPKLNLNTVYDAVNSIEQYFLSAKLSYGQGTLEAYDEAVYLTLFALDLPPFDLDSYLDVALTKDQITRLTDYAQQRVVQRKPVAYITQEGWLMGLPFYIDERVIIPRSFIAEILSFELCEPLKQDPKTILDICTGSGCLAILAANTYPESKVWAIDISEEALEVARINQENYELHDRLTLLQGDLLSPLSAEQTFDLILCNPPYVNAKSVAAFPPEFQQEPSIAFEAGTDGMDLIRKLLKNIYQHMNPKTGILLLEIGQERRYFEAAFPTLKPQWIATEMMEDGVLCLTYQQLKSYSQS